MQNSLMQGQRGQQRDGHETGPDACEAASHADGPSNVDVASSDGLRPGREEFVMIRERDDVSTCRTNVLVVDGEPHEASLHNEGAEQGREVERQWGQRAPAWEGQKGASATEKARLAGGLERFQPAKEAGKGQGERAGVGGWGHGPSPQVTRAAVELLLQLQQELEEVMGLEIRDLSQTLIRSIYSDVSAIRSYPHQAVPAAAAPLLAATAARERGEYGEVLVGSKIDNAGKGSASKDREAAGDAGRSNVRGAEEERRDIASDVSSLLMTGGLGRAVAAIVPVSALLVFQVACGAQGGACVLGPCQLDERSFVLT